MASIAKFMNKSKAWGSEVDIERRRRIIVSLAAYTYEFLNEIIMEDPEFDKMCSEINPSINTGHEVMDKFFREKFDPSTGMWIRDHPELDKLKILYVRLNAQNTLRSKTAN